MKTGADTGYPSCAARGADGRGLLRRRDRDAVLAVHRNAQRLLKPVPVVNPYARELTFHDSQTRTRRDHMKYLTLIRSVALLHQYQRPAKTVQHNGRAVEYIEVTFERYSRGQPARA